MADMHSDDMTVKNALTESGAQGGGKKERFVTKDVVMCVAVLAVIALVAGVLLGLVNWLTYVDPDAAIMERVAEKYGIAAEQVTAEDGRVLNNPGSNSSVSSVFAATDADGEPVAYAYFVSGGGAYKGTVDFIVYVTPDGRIDGIEVYSSSETVSIGGKVLDDDNLAKLEGYDLTSVTDYGTIGSSAIKDEDVYITGATFTSKALMNAVRATAYAFNNYTAEAEI